MQLKKKSTQQAPKPSSSTTLDKQQSQSLKQNPTNLPQSMSKPESTIVKYSPKAGKLSDKVNKVHIKLHHKSNIHGNKHIRSRLKTIKASGVRKRLLSWLAIYAAVFLLATLTFYQSLEANRINSFQSGKDIIIGLQSDSTNLNLNPLTISGSAENSISELIFSSLLQYDDKGKLIGDLAKSFRRLDDGKTIEIKLKNSTIWQDGTPLTAQDIIFTIEKLKDPLIGSPLRDSVLGLSVTSSDNQTILLTHDRTLNALDDITTRIKIAPRHLLKDLTSEEIVRLNYTNIAVGSGPYILEGGIKNRSYSLGSQEESYKQINLNLNSNYYGNKSDSSLILRIFQDQDSLRQALESRVIQTYPDNSSADIQNENFETIKIDLNSGVFSFFNNTSPILSDQSIRQSLKNFIDLDQIYKSVGGATPLHSPLLEVPSKPQPKITPGEARATIIKAGWQESPASKFLIKDDQEFTLELVTSQSEQYLAAANNLKQQWAEVGVKIEILSVPDSELQSNYFFNRNYDILLFGINLSGYIDPYAYWSSSAATDTGLNFSNYRSPLSDVELDAARSAVDPATRQAKLEKFVERWHNDSPALALYTPNVKVTYNKLAIRPVFSQSYVSSPSEIPKILSQSQAHSSKIFETK